MLALLVLLVRLNVLNFGLVGENRDRVLVVVEIVVKGLQRARVLVNTIHI